MATLEEKRRKSKFHGTKLIGSGRAQRAGKKTSPSGGTFTKQVKRKRPAKN
jgi:hypothetical protein